jgi:hypothetical protein
MRRYENEKTAVVQRLVGGTALQSVAATPPHPLVVCFRVLRYSFCALPRVLMLNLRL